MDERLKNLKYQFPEALRPNMLAKEKITKMAPGENFRISNFASQNLISISYMSQTFSVLRNLPFFLLLVEFETSDWGRIFCNFFYLLNMRFFLIGSASQKFIKLATPWFCFKLHETFSACSKLIFKRGIEFNDFLRIES